MNYRDEYKVYFYQNSRTGRVPVLEYLDKILTKERVKIASYITLLRDCDGRLDEPYSRYIGSGIRELRIECAYNRHRIFYIIAEAKKIIFLHAFLKRTPKTPKPEIVRALNNLKDYKINKKLIKYEQET